MLYWLVNSILFECKNIGAVLVKLVDGASLVTFKNTAQSIDCFCYIAQFTLSLVDFSSRAAHLVVDLLEHDLLDPFLFCTLHSGHLESVHLSEGSFAP